MIFIKYIFRYATTIVVLFIILYLSLAIDPLPFKEEFLFDWAKLFSMDKLGHFMMYFGLVMTVAFDMLRSHQTRYLVYIAPVAIAIGGILELVQKYCTTNRAADLFDFIANTGGALMGSVIIFLLFLPLYRHFLRKKTAK